MVSLQVSIGALNDLADEDRDRGRKSGKPIPAGLVGRRTATGLVVAGLVLGLGLAATMGLPALLVALAGVGAGYAYDLRLKATAWAWLPFALGLPLLPVFAWVGVTGRIPAAFLLLVPMAILAGAGLALLNGLVDVDRDRSAGVVTPAVRLGRQRARRLAAGLLGRRRRRCRGIARDRRGRPAGLDRDRGRCGVDRRGRRSGRIRRARSPGAGLGGERDRPRHPRRRLDDRLRGGGSALARRQWTEPQAVASGPSRG